jgi:two-component system KDP operon response regulator KdpE
MAQMQTSSTSIQVNGRRVVITSSAREIDDALSGTLPDMLILDINPPETAEWAVIKVRNLNKSLPVIVLGNSDDPFFISRLLKAGADDYMKEPVVTEELNARTQAIFRRVQASIPPAGSTFSTKVITIDFETQRVTFYGDDIRLTNTEYKLLELLAKRAGEILNYETLLNGIWGSDYTCEKEYLHVYIRHLRKKLELDPSNPKTFINIPGRGYRMERG